VSWDKTMKIWRMWRRSSLQPKKVETSQDIKFETWLWNQLKASLNNNMYDSDEEDEEKGTFRNYYNDSNANLESSLTIASDRLTIRSHRS
jgi:hypothetical protein